MSPEHALAVLSAVADVAGLSTACEVAARLLVEIDDVPWDRLAAIRFGADAGVIRDRAARLGEERGLGCAETRTS